MSDACHPGRPREPSEPPGTCITSSARLRPGPRISMGNQGGRSHGDRPGPAGGRRRRAGLPVRAGRGSDAADITGYGGWRAWLARPAGPRGCPAAAPAWLAVILTPGVSYPLLVVPFVLAGPAWPWSSRPCPTRSSGRRARHRRARLGVQRRRLLRDAALIRVRAGRRAPGRRGVPRCRRGHRPARPAARPPPHARLSGEQRAPAGSSGQTGEPAGRGRPAPCSCPAEPGSCALHRDCLRNLSKAVRQG